MSRMVTQRYDDPLSLIWIDAAQRIGLQVVRTPDAFAASDGAGQLAIANHSQLDADDSLAQMIFHELCHSLVEGPDSFAKADWGMDNTGSNDDWREHACLRLQLVLARRYGLPTLFAPTTDFREFWQQLLAAADPLADRTLLSVRSAIVGLRRVATAPWHPFVAQTLQATSDIAKITKAAITEPAATSLWSGVETVAKHPTGLPLQSQPLRTSSCGTCCWRYGAGAKSRCRQAEASNADSDARMYRAVVHESMPPCERFEAAIDCLSCGACCREAYHSVEVKKRDSFRTFHPDVVVDRGNYHEVQRVPTFAVNPPRDGQPAATRCISLAGGALVQLRVGDRSQPSFTSYACTTYDARPKTCRDFTLGSDNCLQARQRVGMSL
jgi:hypothetical protein